MDELSRRIRRKLLGDLLPRFRPDITSYKLRGNGDWCTACEEPVTPDEFEYEVYCWRAPDLKTIRLHEACFETWKQVSHSLIRLGI